MGGHLKRLTAAAAFAAYAAVGLAAFAQPGPAPAGRAALPHPPPVESRPASDAERAERLRAVLQLKPAQEPALQAYIAAQDTARRGMAGGMGDGPMPATTPERLERMQAMMARHQAAMTAMIDATRRFYDQLDPAQKRAFDALPMQMMGSHGGMMGGMRMRQRGGGMDHRHASPPPAGAAPAPGR